MVQFARVPQAGAKHVGILLGDIVEKFDQLRQSVVEFDVELEEKLNPDMHRCEI